MGARKSLGDSWGPCGERPGFLASSKSPGDNEKLQGEAPCVDKQDKWYSAGTQPASLCPGPIVLYA